MLNNKLLVSHCGSSQLFIYNREGRHLSTILTNNNEKLWDASWTPRGNIVYTTWNHEVVVMSESGKVIAIPTYAINPRYISVSNDNTIYLADWETGVYQSTDDGVKWSLVLKSTDGWNCCQVIKVITDYGDDFWMLEWKGINERNIYRLSVCRVDNKSGSDGNEMRRDINVPTTDDKHIDLHYAKLLYDGNMNIFLNDYHNKAVHVLSVNDQSHCQLLSSSHLKNNPRKLAVDRERQLLYVGQDKSVVEVFELTYGNGG